MYNLNLLPGNCSVTITDETGCEKIIDYEISFQLSNENISSVITQIWPNPTGDFLNIEASYPLENWQIVDISGKRKLFGFGGTESKLRVETNSLVPGIYVFVSSNFTGETIGYYKFVKK